MEKKESNKRKSLFTKLALVAALIIGSSSVAVADELTVDKASGGGNNTYTNNIFINSSLLNTTLIQGEFIIPSSKLADMKDKQITKMAFQLNSATTSWGEAEFKVFLKEVTETSYGNPPSLIGDTDASVVYEGSLDATKTFIDINFTTPFDYSGNNLLIGVYCTKTGTNSNIQFKLYRDDYSTYYTVYTSNTSGALARSYWCPITTFTYQDAVVETPRLSVSTNSIAFGSCRAGDTKTVTVTNTGVGSMDVIIANDNTTDFTVSATSLTGIGAGESRTFDVTFNYDATNLGDKTANITVTPSYDAAEAKAIAVTATAADATVWEDFESGIPTTWYNEKDSWLNYVSGLSGYASPGYQSSDILRTPRLYAEEGEALGFDVKIVGKYSSNVVKAKYSTDRVNWSAEVTYGTDGNYSIVAPATGYYWVEFTASQAGIDNMTGWTIAETIHDTKLGTATIPATGTAHGDYTASVVVKELGGSTETVNAELYFGTEKVAEQTGIALGGNRDVTVTLTYLPTETFSGDVYIKVFGANIGTLETDEVAVEISETPYVFDENSDVNPVISSNSVVKVKYTAQKGWNTIVMPFSLSSSPSYMNTIFGEGWTAYAIDSFDEGKVTFKSTTYMATTTPFLVYAPNAESHPDGVYLQNVSAGSYNWNHKNINQTMGDITFKGTFAPIAAPGMEGKYGVTNKGTVAMGGSGASIKAYRAYLELSEASTARSLTLVIDGEGGTTTAIGELVRTLEGDNGQQVYNLSGQRVEKAKKGLYIVGGKKVIVK